MKVTPFLIVTATFCAITFLPSCRKNTQLSQEEALTLELKIDTLNSRLEKLENQKHQITELTETLKSINHGLQIETKTEIQRIENPGWYLCSRNLRRIHQAVRAQQDLNGKDSGAPIDWNKIFGEGGFITKKLSCPLKADYILIKTYPKVGTPAATCPHAKKHGHHFESTDGW